MCFLSGKKIEFIWMQPGAKDTHTALEFSNKKNITRNHNLI